MDREAAIPGRRTSLADSLAVLAQGNRDLRTLAHLLHPPMLEELGLAGALRHYVEGFSQRSGIRIELECGDDLERCSDAIETALFRVVQESLANVHRHSNSNCAFLKLARAGDNIELTIADRGRGLPAGLLTGTAHGARIGVGISRYAATGPTAQGSARPELEWPGHRCACPPPILPKRYRG